jgi:3-deoxy-7-phosphoheptulonate synthase
MQLFATQVATLFAVIPVTSTPYCLFPMRFLRPVVIAIQTTADAIRCCSVPCLRSGLSVTLNASRETRGLCHMLVVMQSHATEEQVRAVCERVDALGLKAHPIPGTGRTAIGITGNSGAVDLGVLESMPGVIECIPVTKPYKLVSRDVKEEDSIIKITTPSGDVLVGGQHIAMIAGPCAVETEEQCLAVAQQLKSTGIRLFRGGAYKPRTSPYSFQGLGLEGLKILSTVRKQCGFGIVTEAIDNESLDLVEEYADVIQIGARNMQNFSLLKRAGRAKKPVLLKRGMSATLDEFLMAAEYILSEGNYNVMLCERGVRTFSDFSRNTLDLAVVPAVKKRSHLPILVDPSHGTGKRHKVLPLSRAAVAVGADGLLVEVHHEPEKALSDGIQSILPAEFASLAREVQQIAQVLQRRIN